MGTDFLRNKRERHTKAWRQSIARIEGDWLAQTTPLRRVFRARGAENLSLAANQPVVLRLVSDNQVVASVGVHQVATLLKPSLALVEHLKASHGVGVAKVQRASASTQRVDFVVED